MSNKKILKKILVADDEPDVRRLVSMLLTRDYVVLEARDGQEAINIARTEKPDLILMDIMMPKMDGYAACLHIKADQVTRNIPVVMLTAVGYELNKKLAKQSGADGYVTKPFSRQELIDAISPLLATS